MTKLMEEREVREQKNSYGGRQIKRRRVYMAREGEKEEKQRRKGREGRYG